MWTFFGQGKNGRKQPYIMYFARACVRTHILAYVKGKGKNTCRTDTKNSKNAENPARNSSARRPKTEKTPEKCRKRNHQSTIKSVIIPCCMTNNAPKNSHRRHILSQSSRHFLCLPFGKRRFPPRKTYVSRKENLRFTHRKHRKQREKRDLLP